MREFMNLLESQASFVLDPALDPANYQISNSLADVKNWKAKIISGNNIGRDDKQKGDFGDVGYTMISLTTNQIIPIAREDEHHTGFDMLHDLNRKLVRAKGKPTINTSDYVPLFWGNNYIYYKTDVPKYLNVCAKWLSYGGPDGVLKGTHDMSGMMLTLKHFVASKGDVAIKPGTLAPLGTDILNAYKACAQALAKARENPEMASAQNAAFVSALKVIKVLAASGGSYLVGYDDLKQAPAIIKKLKQEGDLKGLEANMFGFNSLKNKMHIEMKTVAKSKNHWDRDNFVSIWGDLDLAIDMLGRF